LDEEKLVVATKKLADYTDTQEVVEVINDMRKEEKTEKIKKEKIHM
jgi:hypothetical protein